MKYFLLTLIFCGLISTAESQIASVEESTFGIQAGVLGIWGHCEMKVSNQFALRSEIGFDAEIWDGIMWDRTGYAMTPVFTLEPRWYYNLNKRVKKNRRIDGNSGNFISLKTNYRPDLFVISNYENMRIISNVSIVPTWGIRRNIGNYFTYEAGIGIGMMYSFSKNLGYSKNFIDGTVNLHLRVGYRF
jgi:hypothetical protein